MATEKTYTAAETNNEFGLKLYNSLPLDKGENCFFSPLSITSALSMTYMGAKGNTARQMSHVMALSSLDSHSCFEELISDIFNFFPNPDLPILKLANRLYGQKGYKFKPEYLSSTQKYYGAQMEAVDFIKEGELARQAINQWVEDQTMGKIQHLIAPGVLTEEVRLVLVNALYFKGDWAEEFKSNNTHDMPFYMTPSNTKIVPMMNQTKMFGYYYDQVVQCKVLVMNYKGGKTSMMIALPDKADGVADLESKLNVQTVRSWAQNVTGMKVCVTLPKFKFTKSFKLGECLQSMGITELFQRGLADLSGISDEELFVSEVIHKAFLEVNEKGTEAAAATAVVMMFGSAMASAPPMRFLADHPFVFFICDRKSGAIMFMGRVMCPVME